MFLSIPKKKNKITMNLRLAIVINCSCESGRNIILYVAVVDDGFIKWEEDETFEVEVILDHVDEDVSYDPSID